MPDQSLLIPITAGHFRWRLCGLECVRRSSLGQDAWTRSLRVSVLGCLLSCYIHAYSSHTHTHTHTLQDTLLSQCSVTRASGMGPSFSTSSGWWKRGCMTCFLPSTASASNSAILVFPFFLRGLREVGKKLHAFWIFVHNLGQQEITIPRHLMLPWGQNCAIFWPVLGNFFCRILSKYSASGGKFCAERG